MIWSDLEVGKKKRTPAGLRAAAIRFNGHENRVNLCQRFWIIKLQDPSFLGGVVFIENSQVQGLAPIRPVLPPSLKRARRSDASLLIEIVGVEDERLSLGVEDTAVGFLRNPVASHVINLSDIEVPRPHQFSDVAVMGEQVLLFAEALLAVAKLRMKVVDLSCQALRMRLLLGALPFKRSELSVSFFERSLRGVELLDERASLLDALLLLSFIILDGFFEIRLSTPHFIERCRLYLHLAPEIGNDAVALRELRSQIVAFVSS